MKVGTVRISELDSAQRLTATSYLDLDDRGLENPFELTVSVVVRAVRSQSKKQINGTKRLVIKFSPKQTATIVTALGAKSVDEVREHVSELVKENVISALTEATRTK